MSPATIEIKHALLTIDNPPEKPTISQPLPDYLIEIAYDTLNPHKPIKLWIHDSKRGITILRIQEKPQFGKVESD